MIRSWISRFRTPPPEAPIAPARPFYAIGDVHGRLDLLDSLLLQMTGDAIQRGLTEAAVVFLGDYVDRGPDSAGVLDRIRALVDETPGDVIALLGNHEAMMLDWLDAPEKHRNWLRHGGLNTLASYGVTGLDERADADVLWRGAQALRAAMPPGLPEWLRGLPLLWQCGNMACVHAGADPARPLEDQDRGTLIWGHRDFMTGRRRDGIRVVHGHTVCDQPEVTASRIGVDTGAFFTDRLTACRVTPDGALGFLEARA